METPSLRRIFFEQFRENFHDTGAILPSGRALARELCRFVDHTGQPDPATPRHYLEVGPGTGAVTDWIVRRMSPRDQLDLVELNDRFVAVLARRFRDEPTFTSVADRVRIHQGAVETFPGQGAYDAIISGLPLNNFTPELVERILARFAALLRPGGTVSFFEYIGIRRLKSVVSRRSQRERLRGVGAAIQRFLQQGKTFRVAIWCNIPPAWAHHVQFDATSSLDLTASAFNSFAQE